MHRRRGPASPTSGGASIDQIRRALASGPLPAKSPLETVTRSASAVLAPLYEHEGEVWVVLTRRSWHLRAHKGEVSFPGGRRDPGESLWETALREAWEEVGSRPVHGRASRRARPPRHRHQPSFIVPYVGLLPGRPELTPNEDEVDAILHVSLSELLDPDIYRAERWGWAGVDRTIHFFELVGDTLWGATGSMLVDLLTRITGEVNRT